MLMDNASGRKVVLSIVLTFMLLESYAMADLINGDFSSPLGPADDLLGWDYWAISRVSEVAVMGDPFDWPYLEQVFTIPDLALTFSFDYKANIAAGGWGSFVASLLDPTTYNPIIPSAAYPAGEYFAHDWYIDGSETIWQDYVTVTDLGGGWNNIRLDLFPTLGGAATDAYIFFDFFSFDSSNSEILIDNVNVTVVPVFSSVLLGVMGLGTSAAFLRRRFRS